MKTLFQLFLLVFFSTTIYSQKLLEEITIKSGRILTPFNEENRSLIIVDSIYLQNTTAKNLSEILQQIIGVDIRRRGNDDIQTDLYIRGGSFDQTLLLINGVKVEDSQTGHHQMNLSLPTHLIERIEILKGPGSRIFGMNAFNGAVNIITKKNEEKRELKLGYGSFKTLDVSSTIPINSKGFSNILSATFKNSDGYRYNTDYNYFNFFYSGNINIQDSELDILYTNSDRKFGANGFYASPQAKDQYEETNASLLNIKISRQSNEIKSESSVFWRRHEDTYIYLRDNPSFYKNNHTSHKIGFLSNVSFMSDIGITGVGIDLSNTWLESNNLGKRNRFISTLFVEQLLKKGKFNITPGVAFSIYEKPNNDIFKSKLFPGVDLSFIVNKNIILHANVGETFRIPTFTDLYYSDPNNEGNENLDPEKAFTNEIGLRYLKNSLQLSMSLFNRKSSNLIDYIKSNPEGKWSPQNIKNVTTNGLEIDSKYLIGNNGSIHFGYAYLNDNYNQDALSRYSLNSYKHRILMSVDHKVSSNVSQFISFRYGVRENQSDENDKSVIDYKIGFKKERWETNIYLNNILDSKYYETNLVEMPGRNISLNWKLIF